MTDLPEAVRHVVRGTEYRTRGVATLQTAKPLADGEAMAVYAGTDGRLWVRPVTEFLDGRFEVIDLPPEDDCARCEACQKEIRPGDRAHPGVDGIYLCEVCAPTYADLLSDPGGFGNPDDNGMKPEEAQEIVRAHLDAGGSITDKILSTF